MTAGLKVWDQAGNLVFGSNHRLGSYMGYVDTGMSDGYIEHPHFNTNRPIFLLLPLDSTGYAVPTVTVEMVGLNKLIVWRFPVGVPFTRACRILFGAC